jgi:hypothetical protein
VVLEDSEHLPYPWIRLHDSWRTVTIIVGGEAVVRAERLWWQQLRLWCGSGKLVVMVNDVRFRCTWVATLEF